MFFLAGSLPISAILHEQSIFSCSYRHKPQYHTVMLTRWNHVERSTTALLRGYTRLLYLNRTYSMVGFWPYQTGVSTRR